MKILCVGEATYDTIYSISQDIYENAYLQADSKTECGGGASSNIAYLLAKWKMESYFAGTIGKDDNGKEILKEFNDIGVKTNFLEINKDITTSSNFIISNLDNLSCTILNYHTNDIKADVEIDITPDIIVLDGSEYELSKKVLEQYPKAISFLYLNNYTKNDVLLGQKVDYVICSSMFASKLANIRINYKNSNTLINMFNKLNRAFKNIIISLEDMGCLYEIDGSMKIMPYMKLEPVDRVSSNEIFLGALVYGISNKFDIEKSLKYANIARSISVTRIGGRTSIPTLDEVEDIYATLK